MSNRTQASYRQRSLPKLVTARLAVCALSSLALLSQSARAAGARPRAEVSPTVAEKVSPSKESRPGKMGDSQVGIGAGFFVEDSERREQSLRGGQELRTSDPEEVVSASVFNVQAWYLQPIFTPNLRWGGGLAWFSGYAVEPPDAEEDDEPYGMGQLFQLGLQAEYEIPGVVSALGVVLGVRVGGALLFSGKNLESEVEELERRGFDVWGGPAPGVYVAPLIGVRWPLSERVNLRADLSAQFAKLWLYSAHGEAAGITTGEKAQLSTTRTQLLVGLDFDL